MSPTETTRTGAPAALAAAMLSLPFMIPPTLTMPVGFGPEWLAVAIGIAGVLAALRSGTLGPLPVAAAWLLLLIVVFLFQTLAFDPPYPQYAVLASSCVLYAALMLQLGGSLADAPHASKAAPLLACALLAAALANAVTGLIQAGVPAAATHGWLAPLVGTRAYGLIQYTNPYAGFLMIGAVALAWLWSGKRVCAPWAPACALLLGAGAAVSGSRSVVLYLAWMCAMAGLMLLRPGRSPQRAALARSLLVTAACIAVAQLATPALALLPGQPAAISGTLVRIEQAAQGGEPRLVLWQLALALFGSAPLAGVGIGRFAEAAFNFGLPGPLQGSIWTSSHNLLLDTLAETGLAGSMALLAGLALIIRGAIRRLAVDDGPAWFAATAAGIALLHAMLEYPLRFAHFLGLTALLLGWCSTARPPHPASGAAARALTWLACGVLGAMLLLAARDWQLLDRVRRQGTWQESAARSGAAREDLRTLVRGPLGAEVERWMLLGTPLTPEHLTERLALADRVSRYWPGSDTLTRRAIFQAFAGQTGPAAATLRHTLAAFPGRTGLIRALILQAAAVDPIAMQPLIGLLAPQPEDASGSSTVRSVP